MIARTWHNKTHGWATRQEPMNNTLTHINSNIKAYHQASLCMSQAELLTTCVQRALVSYQRRSKSAMTKGALCSEQLWDSSGKQRTSDQTQWDNTHFPYTHPSEGPALDLGIKAYINQVTPVDRWEGGLNPWLAGIPGTGLPPKLNKPNHRFGAS